MGRKNKNAGKKKKGPTAAQQAVLREQKQRKAAAQQRKDSAREYSYDTYGGDYYSSYPYDSYDSDHEGGYDQESKSDYRPGGYHWVEIGDTFNDGIYRVEAKLGWGHFSTVWLAFDTEYKQYVALKIQKSDPHYTTAARDEIDLLTSVTRNDPDGRKGVVRLLDHFTHHGPNGEHVCMVFDLLGQNLLKFIDQYHHTGLPVKLSIVKHITKQILIGLDFLHACCGIIHTDLKPENVSFVWSAAMASLPKEAEIHKPARIRRLGRDVVVPVEVIQEYNTFGDAPFLSRARKSTNGEGDAGDQAGNKEPETPQKLSRNQKKKLKKKRAAAAAKAAAEAEAAKKAGDVAGGNREGAEGEKGATTTTAANGDAAAAAPGPGAGAGAGAGAASVGDQDGDQVVPEVEAAGAKSEAAGPGTESTADEGGAGRGGRHVPIRRTPSWDAHNNLEGYDLSALPPPMLPASSFDSDLGRTAILYSNFSVKLVDLGNACWVHKHFTDDIQTRQYRSPEVILGHKYGPNTDLWSLACIVFELLTDDFLFDPKAGDGWDREDDHLAQMAELMGKFPRSLTSGHYAKKFFNRKGELKHIKELKYWTLADVMKDKYNFDPGDAEEIADFLTPMLELDPRRRANAHQMLKHPFLREPFDASDLTHEDIDWEVRRVPPPQEDGDDDDDDDDVSDDDDDDDDDDVDSDHDSDTIPEDKKGRRDLHPHHHGGDVEVEIATVAAASDPHSGHKHHNAAAGRDTKVSPMKRRSTTEDDAPARRISVEDDPFASPKKGSPQHHKHGGSAGKGSPSKGKGKGKGKGNSGGASTPGTPPKAPKPAQ